MENGEVAPKPDKMYQIAGAGVSASFAFLVCIAFRKERRDERRLVTHWCIMTAMII